MKGKLSEQDLIQTFLDELTIQKPHIDLYLIHHSKNLGDDYLILNLLAELKSCYSYTYGIYTLGSKIENTVVVSATSDDLRVLVSLPGNAFVFTAALQLLKMALIVHTYGTYGELRITLLKINLQNG